MNNRKRTRGRNFNYITVFDTHKINGKKVTTSRIKKNMIESNDVQRSNNYRFKNL